MVVTKQKVFRFTFTHLFVTLMSVMFLVTVVLTFKLLTDGKYF
jgi:hypothetical protein